MTAPLTPRERVESMTIPGKPGVCMFPARHAEYWTAGRIQILLDHIDLIRQRYIGLLVAFNELAAELEEANSRAEAAERQLAEKDARIADLQTEIENLDGSYEPLRSLAGNLKAEVKRYREKYGELE